MFALVVNNIFCKWLDAQEKPKAEGTTSAPTVEDCLYAWLALLATSHKPPDPNLRKLIDIETIRT